MSATYSTTVKNNRLQQVINGIDGGSGSGKLKIYTTALGTLLSTITLAKPSFGTPSGGAMTAAGVPLTDTNAAATGTAAAATIEDSAGNVIVSGLTVGTSGTDIILGTATINAGDEVILNSGTITHG